MSRGLTSLRGYQRGGPIPLGGGLAALLSRKFGRAASRLAPLFFGKRSETGYVPGISEAIYNAVEPDYQSVLQNPDQLKDALRRIARGDPGDTPSREWRDIWALNVPEGRSLRPVDEEDAWRIYLGLDQEGGTFKESEFRPTVSSGEDVRYREFADPERVINTLASRAPYSAYTDRSGWAAMSEEERRRRTLEGLERMISSGKPGISADHPWGHREVEGGPFITTDFMGTDVTRPPSQKDWDLIDEWGNTRGETGDVMGNYTLSAGEDERGPYISYYDKWDLGPQVGPAHIRKAAQISKAGNPFDVYGRMYYDPETYEYRGSSE